MGREIKRVALDFDWPLDKVWEGFLMPERLAEKRCPDCTHGYTPHAQWLQDLWYGKAPFRPEDNGSTPFTPDHPAIRAFAERNCSRSPEYYGTSEFAIDAEARRLAQLMNGSWMHHLSQDDVDALVAAGRLMDFTHTWSAETRWQRIEPTPQIKAARVNEWSIMGMGHDAINCGAVVDARCRREGQPSTCATCGGHASLEAYEGQRDEAENWVGDEPPAGEGWQLWETVSEGSPISPVFATAEGLARWMASPAYKWGIEAHWTYDDALKWITDDGWAPSMMSTVGDDGSVEIKTF